MVLVERKMHMGVGIEMQAMESKVSEGMVTALW